MASSKISATPSKPPNTHSPLAPSGEGRGKSEWAQRGEGPIGSCVHDHEAGHTKRSKR